MPVMLVVGARDPMINSIESARRLEHAAPNTTVRVLPDAGHILPRQTTAILEFLARTWPAGSHPGPDRAAA